MCLVVVVGFIDMIQILCQNVLSPVYNVNDWMMTTMCLCVLFFIFYYSFVIIGEDTICWCPVHDTQFSKGYQTLEVTCAYVWMCDCVYIVRRHQILYVFYLLEPITTKKDLWNLFFVIQFNVYHHFYQRYHHFYWQILVVCNAILNSYVVYKDFIFYYR